MSSLESEAAILACFFWDQGGAESKFKAFILQQQPGQQPSIVYPDFDPSPYGAARTYHYCALYSTLLEICLHLLVDTAPITHPIFIHRKPAYDTGV